VDSLDAELIELSVRKSRSIRPPLIGILTTLRDEAAAVKTGFMDAAGLRAIAERTQELIVGAYDGEGFVVWRPHHA
jgi:hypothetical protein